jgi:hypothetical protein
LLDVSLNHLGARAQVVSFTAQAESSMGTKMQCAGEAALFSQRSDRCDGVPRPARDSELWAEARNFVLQDQMFEPNASWSLPAHLYSPWSSTDIFPGLE